MRQCKALTRWMTATELLDYRRSLTAAPGEVSVRFAIVDQIEEWFGEKDENSTG